MITCDWLGTGCECSELVGLGDGVESDGKIVMVWKVAGHGVGKTMKRMEGLFDQSRDLN